MVYTSWASPVCLVIWSIWFVLLLDQEKPNKLNQPNKRNRPNRHNEQDRLAGFGLDRLVTTFMKNPG